MSQYLSTLGVFWISERKHKIISVSACKRNKIIAGSLNTHYVWITYFLSKSDKYGNIVSSIFTVWMGNLPEYVKTVTIMIKG